MSYGLRRRGIWTTVTLVVTLCLAIRGVAIAADDASSHLERHRVELGKFMEMREADPKRALAFAQAAVDRTQAMSIDDQRRGDALEMLALAHVAFEQYDKALPAVSELVRIRKAAKPVDNELLALALGSQALVFFAADRAAEADAALREQLRIWRAAFGPNDIRLAQKLELQAEYPQKGFGRTRWVVELLEEAVRIRTENSDSSRGKLAETLQELAIHQMLLSRLSDADQSLDRAQRLIEGEIAANPQREENKAGLAQMLVMRAGIAGALEKRGDAEAYVKRARGLRFKDRLLQAENEILVATAYSTILERSGELPAAINEQRSALDVYARYKDLTANGSLDPGGIGDTYARLGTLYLEKRDLVEARKAIKEARRILGATTELLFAMSELERLSGAPELALELYQEALNSRKIRASEVTVMFGTNRVPVRGKEEGAFGGETAATVILGRAVVLVPGGEFSDEASLASQRITPIPVGKSTNPGKLLIRSKKTLDAKEFELDVHRLTDATRLYPRSALIFVHGFNVDFDEALQRTAQLARDLNYDGPMFVYSWPSKGRPTDYGSDRVSAGRAVDGLLRFLHTVEAVSGAEKIHLIAHSMGNRVLLPALVKATADEVSPTTSKLGEVVLAAPAVPRKEFGEWIDELHRHGFDHLTLYASAIDRALLLGNVREGLTTLAGYVANGEPLLHPPVQSIDISEAGGETWHSMNHDVFASNPVVTEDLRQLLQKGERPPEKRIQNLELRKSKAQDLPYWYYHLSPR